MTSSPPSGSESARRSRRFSSNFERLARPVQQWIWRSGWQELRDIQEQAIPLLLSGENDLVIAAPTAAGKTEAAFVPLLSRLVKARPKAPGFNILYVSPLKALINDQFRRLDDLCESLDIPVHRWHGDVSSVKKQRAVRNPRGILLITPESLEAMFVRRGLEIPRLFAATSCVVVDELHSMLDTERGVQLRSLLNRMEVSVRRRVRRVGLSATLGDMNLAGEYLRPNSPGGVKVIRSESEGQEIKLLLKGYLIKLVSNSMEEDRDGEDDDNDKEAPGSRRRHDSTKRSIAAHVFKYLRGQQNLVFANRRQEVELYADRLRNLAETMHLPNEFYAHHSSLARQHREFVEKRLRKASEPTTAVCTSTLELGIDIGQVASIAQIGPPYSVSSTRQRLGRSGRREGTAAVLRTYIQETEVDYGSHPADELRLRLVRSVAILELLIEGWCEPPEPGALHLSTFVQQVLSVIAERGGASARLIFDVLCRKGPFRAVSTTLFARVLRSMAQEEAPLIEQAPDGTLLLGPRGEQIVEHYSFYAVFTTPEEYRVMADGRVLGTLPVDFAVVEDSTIIFAGKRWRVTAVDPAAKVIEVKPDPTGQPPKFSGSPGLLHDRVAHKMRALYSSDSVPAYLDATARRLLAEGRTNYRLRGLNRTSVLGLGASQSVILPWRGTIATETLALALSAEGLKASAHDHVLIEVRSHVHAVQRALQALASQPAPDPVRLASLMRNLEREKYHRYLSPDLQCVDAASARVVADVVPGLAAELLSQSGRRPAAPSMHPSPARGATGWFS